MNGAVKAPGLPPRFRRCRWTCPVEAGRGSMWWRASVDRLNPPNRPNTSSGSISGRPSSSSPARSKASCLSSTRGRRSTRSQAWRKAQRSRWVVACDSRPTRIATVSGSTSFLQEGVSIPSLVVTGRTKPSRSGRLLARPARRAQADR